MLKNKIHIYPNPAQNELLVETNIGLGSYEITLKDELGQTVMHFSNSSQKYKRDISVLPSGLYYIELNTEKSGSIREKVVIQR